jgi:16S rRNA (uracil1498-N3)-methyltransferase
MDAQDIFYVHPQDVGFDSLTIRGDEFHHLTHVFRKKSGERFAAVDGRGNYFDCAIELAEKDFLRARILKKKRLFSEPLFKLTLALALLKKGKFEWVVEKATEVGVSSFIPLQTEHTIPQSHSINPKRCQRIALAAMKQCRRSILPAVAPVQSFEELCRNAGEFDLKLLAHEKAADASLDQILANGSRYPKSGVLCIGPEGGFSADEEQQARESGFAIFGMGPRRLRSETAAIIGAALVLDRLGELK